MKNSYLHGYRRKAQEYITWYTPMLCVYWDLYAYQISRLVPTYTVWTPRLFGTLDYSSFAMENSGKWINYFEYLQINELIHSVRTSFFNVWLGNKFANSKNSSKRNTSAEKRVLYCKPAETEVWLSFYIIAQPTPKNFVKTQRVNCS